MHNRPQTSQTSLIASLACICSILVSNLVHGYLEPHQGSAQDNPNFRQKSATQRPTPRFSTLPESLFLTPQGNQSLQSAEHAEVVPSRRVFISPIRKRDREDGEVRDESEDIAVVDLPVGASTTPAHLTSHHQRITTSDPTLSPYVTQRSTDDSTSLFVTNPIVAVLICILVIVLIVATVLGNCMVCLAVLMVRKLKSQPANLLLISLAVADCCVGLLVMPVALVNILDERWILGEVVCRLWTSADLTLCTASILNLCAISVDRYWAVTRALRYAAQRTRRLMYCYIAVVWVGALFVSVAPLLLLPLKDVDDSCQVSQNRVYQIYATIISFYGPCLIMVVVYVQMWRAAKRLQKRDKLTMKWSLGLAPVCESPNSSFDKSDSPAKKPNKSPRFGFRKNMSNNNSNNNSINATSPIKDQQTSLLPPMSHLRKFQHKNSSPLLTSHTAHSTTTASLVTVAAVIQSPLKRFQRPSALLNAVRMPLLHSRPHHEKGEDKARKTLGVIMSVFIICWVPFFILALVKSQYVIHVPKWLDMLVLWLGYSNSMLNPLIYCKYNREFRVPFKEMLCCRFGTIQTVMRNESFHHRFGAPRLAPDFKFSTGKAGKSNSNGTIRTGPHAKNNNNNGDCLNSNNFPTRLKRNSSPCAIDYLSKGRASSTPA